MLIYVCVLITYYLFILVTLKAESLLIIVYSLSKSDDRQESVFKYWWWENSQTNMTSFYKYSVHLLLILITLSNHIFFMNPMEWAQPTPPTLQDRRCQAHPPDVPLISRMPEDPALIILVVWTTWGQETCLHLVHGA